MLQKCKGKSFTYDMITTFKAVLFLSQLSDEFDVIIESFV